MKYIWCHSRQDKRDGERVKQSTEGRRGKGEGGGSYCVPLKKRSHDKNNKNNDFRVSVEASNWVTRVFPFGTAVAKQTAQGHEKGKAQVQHSGGRMTERGCSGCMS